VAAQKFGVGKLSEHVRLLMNRFYASLLREVALVYGNAALPVSEASQAKPHDHRNERSRDRSSLSPSRATSALRNEFAMQFGWVRCIAWPRRDPTLRALQLLPSQQQSTWALALVPPASKLPKPGMLLEPRQICLECPGKCICLSLEIVGRIKKEII